MRPPRRLAVALGFALLLGLLAASSAAAPPPTQLCGVCDSPIADANATEPQTLEIAIDADGDSRWVERVPVDDVRADRYAANASLLEADLEEAFYRYHVAGGVDALDPAVDLEAGTVVVTYEIPNFARPGVGDAWLVDYFALGPTHHRYQLAADRVDLRTPEGAVVTNEPRYASVDGDTATWEPFATGTLEADFDAQTHVTYGPDDGALALAAGQATIALEVGPMVARHAFLGGGPPALFLGLVAVGIGRMRLARAGRFGTGDAATLARRIATIGVVGGIGLYVLGALGGGALRDPNAVVAGALGVGYAGLALSSRPVDGPLETRGLLARSIFAAALAVALAWSLAGPVAGAYAAWMAVPTAGFLPLGHAVGRDARGAPAVVLGCLLALVPIVATATVAPVGIFGFGALGYGVFQLNWVFVVAVFGAPLAFLGRRLAREAPSN